jgi:hypothetical protein
MLQRRYAVSAASGRLLVRRDRRPAGPDPAALTAGLAVLLRQHHPAHLQVCAHDCRDRRCDGTQI